MTSDVIGLDVTTSDASDRALGRLASIVIDPSTNRAEYAVIDRGGVLGWSAHHVIVPFQLLKFAGQWDRPSLNMDAFKLENGPHVRDQDIEKLLNDPAWVRSLSDYFGVALAAAEPSAQSTPPAPTVTASATKPTSAAAHGETVAQRYCAACHTLNSGGGALVGPNLYGVFGRPVASVPGYNYSAPLKARHGAWDQAGLDAFLKSPRADVPGTFMTFPGISSATDRQDVIAYLQTLGQKTGANK